MNTYPIVVEELTKVYGHRAVVDRVSLSTEPAQIHGLLGPNGAGKTTLIKMLVGLTRPTHGSIRIFGDELARHPNRIKQQIGHVYANMAFYRHLNALENLKFFGQLYRLRRARLRERIEETLRFVDLWDERTKRVGAYSQGMTQRLGVAKALLHDPRILLFDEAMAGIDVEGRCAIRGMITELRDAGKTIILATHELYEADEVCDRIALLFRGTLVAYDTPAGLKRQIEGQLSGQPESLTSSVGRHELERWIVPIPGAEARRSPGTDRPVGSPAAPAPQPTLEQAFLAILHQRQRGESTDG